MSNAGSGLTETVVMKFGGTSVADAERIKRAARRIVAAREEGNRVVAVLSARGKTTDELLAAGQAAALFNRQGLCGFFSAAGSALS